MPKPSLSKSNPSRRSRFLDNRVIDKLTEPDVEFKLHAAGGLVRVLDGLRVKQGAHYMAAIQPDDHMLGFPGEMTGLSVVRVLGFRKQFKPKLAMADHLGAFEVAVQCYWRPGQIYADLDSEQSKGYRRFRGMIFMQQDLCADGKRQVLTGVGKDGVEGYKEWIPANNIICPAIVELADSNWTMEDKQRADKEALEKYDKQMPHLQLKAWSKRIEDRVSFWCMHQYDHTCWSITDGPWVKRKPFDAQKVHVVDTFAGMGTMTVAAQTASNDGFKAGAVIEWDRDAMSTAMLNIADPNCVYLNKGMEDVVAELKAGRLPELASLKDRVGFFHGSPPCQKLSRRNKHSEGPNYYDFDTFKELFLFMRPATGMIEEVEGFLLHRTKRNSAGPEQLEDHVLGLNHKRQKHAQSRQGKPDPSMLEHPFLPLVWALIEEGYQVRVTVSMASHYGVPQYRRRVFIYLADLGYQLATPPKPAYATAKFPFLLEDPFYHAGHHHTVTYKNQWDWLPADAPDNITLAEAIGDLPLHLPANMKHQGEKTQKVGYGSPSIVYQPENGWAVEHADDGDVLVSQYAQFMRRRHRIKQVLPTSATSFLWHHQKDNEEGITEAAIRAGNCRMDRDSPSCTLLTSNMGSFGRDLLPDADRLLTVAEAKRLMGFPDWWDMRCRTEDMRRQLGNAVCYLEVLYKLAEVWEAYSGQPAIRPPILRGYEPLTWTIEEEVARAAARAPQMAAERAERDLQLCQQSEHMMYQQDAEILHAAGAAASLQLAHDIAARCRVADRSAHRHVAAPSAAERTSASAMHHADEFPDDADDMAMDADDVPVQAPDVHHGQAAGSNMPAPSHAVGVPAPDKSRNMSAILSGAAAGMLALVKKVRSGLSKVPGSAADAVAARDLTTAASAHTHKTGCNASQVDATALASSLLPPSSPYQSIPCQHQSLSPLDGHLESLQRPAASQQSPALHSHDHLDPVVASVDNEPAGINHHSTLEAAPPNVASHRLMVPSPRPSIPSPSLDLPSPRPDLASPRPTRRNPPTQLMAIGRDKKPLTYQNKTRTSTPSQSPPPQSKHPATTQPAGSHPPDMKRRHSGISHPALVPLACSHTQQASADCSHGQKERADMLQQLQPHIGAQQAETALQTPVSASVMCLPSGVAAQPPQMDDSHDMANDGTDLAAQPAIPVAPVCDQDQQHQRAECQEVAPAHVTQRLPVRLEGLHTKQNNLCRLQRSLLQPAMQQPAIVGKHNKRPGSTQIEEPNKRRRCTDQVASPGAGNEDQTPLTNSDGHPQEPEYRTAVLDSQHDTADGHVGMEPTPAHEPSHPTRLVSQNAAQCAAGVVKAPHIGVIDTASRPSPASTEPRLLSTLPPDKPVSPHLAPARPPIFHRSGFHGLSSASGAAPVYPKLGRLSLTRVLAHQALDLPQPVPKQTDASAIRTLPDLLPATTQDVAEPTNSLCAQHGVKLQEQVQRRLSPPSTPTAQDLHRTQEVIDLVMEDNIENTV